MRASRATQEERGERAGKKGGHKKKKGLQRKLEMLKPIYRIFWERLFSSSTDYNSQPLVSRDIRGCEMTAREI